MKATIKSASFVKEFESKFGPLFSHKITWDVDGVENTGYYSSKSKDQKKFVAGQEAEFDVEMKEGKNGMYAVVRPVLKKGFSNFGKNLKREQSKYSGFAMAYAKDLVVSGHIKAEQMFPTAEKMLKWMVEQDKKLES